MQVLTFSEKIIRSFVAGVTAIVMVGGLVTVLSSPTSAAGPRPAFQLPCPCGQKWRLDTWGHAPALDMVKEPDQVGTEGSLLVAPASGRVNQSFFHSNAGNLIQIDHRGANRELRGHGERATAAARVVPPLPRVVPACSASTSRSPSNGNTLRPGTE